MALSTVEEIRKAEKEADDLVSSAKDQARLAEEEATKKAEAERDARIASAKADAAQMLAEASDAAKASVDAALQKNAVETDALRESARTRMDDAVSAVIRAITEGGN